MSSGVFTNKSRKIVLVAKVKDVPYKCHLCRKIFISDPYLRRHYERRHPSFTYPQLPSEAVVSEQFDSRDRHGLLNAAEKIEHLLSNLTCRDDLDTTFDNPLANSTQNDINEESAGSRKETHMEVELDSSLDNSSKSFQPNEQSSSTSSGECEGDSFNSKESLPNLEKSYLQCLDFREKELAERLTSPKGKPQEQIDLERFSMLDKSNLACMSFDGGSQMPLENETLSQVHSRLREGVLQKLNTTLRRYGIDPNWESITDSTANNIGRLLKTSRDASSKCNPNYDRIRDLINHNINRRIQMSLEKNSFNV